MARDGPQIPMKQRRADCIGDADIHHACVRTVRTAAQRGTQRNGRSLNSTGVGAYRSASWPPPPPNERFMSDDRISVVPPLGGGLNKYHGACTRRLLVAMLIALAPIVKTAQAELI